MPIYEYECRKCKKRFEVFQGVNEDGKELICPQCQANNPQRILSLFSSGSGKVSAASCGPSGST